MDNQWPRYEVFKQDAPGQPHQNVGTIHAPDAEIALLNARDVFGRRPSCHSMWVAPSAAILSVTAEELAGPEWQRQLAEVRQARPEGALKTYRVFQKLSQKRSMTFVTHTGEVQAASPVQALALALEQSPGPEVYVWWICPVEAMAASDPGVVASWFEPAAEKIYRQQSYYGNVKRVSRETRAKIEQQLSQTPAEETV